MDEKCYNREELKGEHEKLLATITDEQKLIYDEILHAVNHKHGGMFFVYGYGGTGKTFLWRVLGSALRSRGKIVLNVASSGIAALLLQEGRTAHSRFGIPIAVNEFSTCSISAGSHQADLIKEAELIIWDEAPTMSKHCFQTLDRTMRDILKCDKVFGGKVIVFGGDFLQILPVIVGGDGKINEPNNGEIEIDIPEDLLVSESEDPIRDIVKEVYGNSYTRERNPKFYQERAILSPRNEDVDKIDEYMLSQIKGEERSYLSSDSIDTSDTSKIDDMVYTQEYLNRIKISGLPNHDLKLKIGAPIMLLRRIDPKGGLCNGTRLLSNVEDRIEDLDN
ncbi:PREDICTED: ATP-dependent DNA helicase pif1-like [Brassica oleracea var. oleracea]|uniref:ATP-dependent DNA helicase pif1-like n=1 Tax=Brassica oleracea var. oleracea TaxID=109376 RepID=UPI0006A721CE|nr:PREDICTED: ATP-dependent DNA helicase pif1-like [Brassica oleracea var. oleracea]